jgi:hypothetical protein
MVLKLKNTKGISKYILSFSQRIERAIILEMGVMVAQLENHAKASAGYEDQTSNLKGSIGGVVLDNGRKVAEKGFDSDGSEGNATGREFVNSLIGNHPSGLVMIIVAGMEYATYQEDFHNNNVLKKSELKMQRELPIMMKRLKLKIDKAA